MTDNKSNDANPIHRRFKRWLYYNQHYFNELPVSESQIGKTDSKEVVIESRLGAKRTLSKIQEHNPNLSLSEAKKLCEIFLNRGGRTIYNNDIDINIITESGNFVLPKLYTKPKRA